MKSISHPNFNRVATITPNRDDLFVIVVLHGKIVIVRPITAYESVLSLVEKLSNLLVVKRPYTIKVICVTASELAQFCGFSWEDILKHQTPAQDMELQRVAVKNCMDAIANSLDPVVRQDARNLMVSLGVLPPAPPPTSRFG